jgi:hypothetical protein
MDTTELEKQLEEARQARVAQCNNEIQAVLEKHDCILVPVITHVGMEKQAYVQVRAK